MEIETKLFVQSVTVSVELSEKPYGTGESRFVSLRGQYPGMGVAHEDIESKIIPDSLDMFMTAWKSLLSAKFVEGDLTGDQLKESLAKAMKKTDSIKAYLKRINDEQRPA